MINNANAYAKCKNCDRIDGNYSSKGTNNDKNKVSTMAAALHINSKHIRSKGNENDHPPRFCGFVMRFG
jgi:hypothetical protein